MLESKIPYIVMTAHGTIDRATFAIKNGAYDFLEKPFVADRLITTLQNALERQKLDRIVSTLRKSARDSFAGMVGSSPAMQVVYRSIESAAATDAPVFIVGESGTGKELCAKAVHNLSKRSNSSCVALNCAAIPTDLIESELFGFRKGAFSGATTDSKGAVGEAQNGTLFLDELLEMDMALQVKLLRFAQSGSYRPLGASSTLESNIRIISATNRSVAKEVQAGRFREDLFFRLHVLPITLPPLRDREYDAVTLAGRFLQRFGQADGKEFDGFDATAIDKMLSHRWPGNVRELENYVRQIVAMEPGGTIGVSQLPSFAPFYDQPGEAAQKQVPSFGNAPTSQNPDEIRPLWKIEKDAIEAAIRQCDGNVAQAAARLEVTPSTIYRKRSAWENTP